MRGSQHWKNSDSDLATLATMSTNKDGDHRTGPEIAPDPGNLEHVVF